MNPQQWYVLVEESIGYNQGLSWQMTQMRPVGDFEAAVALAQEFAMNHVPRNPLRPKGRAVFRTQDGGWVVWLEGATANFHFRVSVVEYYGTFPGKPSA